MPVSGPNDLIAGGHESPLEAPAWLTGLKGGKAAAASSDGAWPKIFGRIRSLLDRDDRIDA